MRRLRDWWHRLRGWWLLVVAAAATAVLSAVGREYTGVAAAIAVAVGGVVAAVLSERGRAQLFERAETAAKPGSPLYVSRVDRISDPIRLGVHPAAVLERADGGIDRVPPFIERDRSLELAEALRAGGFVLLVGDSTAGKTRLAYETMRACLPHHVCVVPENPDALSAAIAAARQNRPSVLWLDDLERYLVVGGLTRADLAGVLDGKTGQVVVLATLRGHERERLSPRHDAAREHGDRQEARTGREALDAVTKEIRLERRWSGREVAAARAFDDDFRVGRAIASAEWHGLAEHMAAGPELLRELRDAWSAGSGRARGAALVTAAVDVRRTRYHRPLPLELLRDLHESYLHDRGGAALRPESWDTALEWATQPLHATSSLLEPSADEEFLAFDYLVDAAAQDPATPPVPDATWHAVLEHATPPDLVGIAWAASFVGGFDHVWRALDRALALNEYVVAAALADCLGDAGQEVMASARLETIIAEAEASGQASTEDLLRMRNGLAWMVGGKVAGRGDSERALRIAQNVVRESTTVLGDDHPRTLHARLTLARQLGACGAEQEALTLSEQVAADATRSHGPGHDTTLSARFEVAAWTWAVAGADAGARHFATLLEYAESMKPAPLGLIASCRWNLGGALLETGDAADAVGVLAMAVAQAGQAFGAEHSHTLYIQLSHADAVGAAGEPRRAASLAAQLALDCVQHLGEDNPTTRDAQELAKRWASEANGLA